MKKGMTLISIIIYLVLFTVFTAFAVSLSSNMNRNVLTETATYNLQGEYSKTYMNLFDSAKKSTSFAISDNNLRFSNGDLYVFDTANNVVYKNGGVLANYLHDFDFKELLEIEGVDLASSILEKSESLCLNVSFSRFDTEISRDIVVSLDGGGV
ncbi:MAG: hypothetical protein IJ809_00665 [Clostridia bacterium]|nr:hypothetical protein [Clostridia bacterium]